ncbi:FAD-binding oxidoreductase [Solirubrobacter ginsenosidimutans]|uniref:FAD-binding oxidoreductase n=1 Tax=Solirubrobacter ginsenosidimutans TaxID=490573 RepID=A0A9X3S147_9ACTN|nr:FAD-binding oxidoreductase [Solirubrobacter ginsenosidimutans]MDA0160697.1 FAD-binding oxidoreductase [Solirubrobacter ginsenosidimutans]
MNRETVHTGRVTRRTLLAATAALLAGADLAEARRLTPKQVRALKAAVRGRVLTPSSAGYDAARVVFNRRYDGVKPPAVVQVKDAADVRAVVEWANRFEIPLVSRSGGHGYNGDSTSATAVVVDLNALNRISYRDGTATLGPGARTLAVYTALARHGAMIPAGSCPTVGVGGLVLGGGMGLAGRAYGLTLDRVTSFDAVTADGKRRRVDDGDALFWALRGGGGSFAIVTAIRVKTPHVTHAAFFSISYPRAAREEALAAWDALAPHAPRALTAILTLDSGGASAFGQYLGSEPALRALIRPLGGTPVVGSADYLTVQKRWVGAKPARTTFAASSLYVRKPLTHAARTAFLGAADTGAALILDAYGGAINRPHRADTAFPHRDERFSVQVLSYAPIMVAKARVRHARRLIAPYGSGAYANYADPDLTNALRAYYGANLPRLRRIKHELDPANRFRPAQGIR